MVKQVSTKTLDDVVRELKTQNRTLQQQLEVDKTTLQEQIQTRMDALGQQAQRFRETISNTVAGVQSAAQNEAVRNRVGAGFGRATGKMIGPATVAAVQAASVPIGAVLSTFAALGTTLMRYSKPLGRVANLVRIGAFSLGLPALISFIADGIWSRPAFQKTIDTIKTTLNEEVWPALQGLVSAVADIAGFFVGVALAIKDSFGGGTLGAIVDGAMAIYTRIQDSVQDLLLDIVAETVKLLPVVINTITSILQLDFLTAWDTLTNGIIDGLSAVLDSLLTNIIQLVFPNAFGESGSLFNSIRGFFSDMVDGIKNGFITVKDNLISLWDTYVVGTGVSLVVEMITIKNRIKDGFTSFVNDVTTGWAEMIAFFVSPNRVGSIPYRINEIKTSVSTAWNDLVTTITERLPGSFTEIKDSIIATLSGIVGTLYIEPIETAIKHVMAMFGFDPQTIAEFSLVDMVLDNTRLIKDQIVRAFENAVTFLNFLPDELGLLLKEKYINLKFMFLEKLQSFMNVFAGIIPGLKVEAMNVIRNLPLGKRIIGDGMYNDALAEQSAALSGNAAAISAIRSDRDTQLEALAIQRLELDAARAALQRDGGAGGMSVNNTQTSNTVNVLNGSQPTPNDNNALSYRGANIPVL